MLVRDGRAGPREARVTESGYRQVEHTADLMIELWAPTEEGLLLAGARAVIDLMVEGAAVEARSSRALAIDGAVDREDRLVRWLNEILALAVLDGFLTTDAEVTLREGGLAATLKGEADAARRIRTELKSVTYHRVAVERADGRWAARVVIDV